FLRKILVQEGEEALLNQPVAIFTETKEESIEGYEPEGEAAAAEEVKELTQEEGEEKPKEKKKKAELEAVKKGLSAPGFTPEPPLEEYEFEWREKPSERILASPLAKQLASERNIDLSAIKGSGPG